MNEDDTIYQTRYIGIDVQFSEFSVYLAKSSTKRGNMQRRVVVHVSNFGES